MEKIVERIVERPLRRRLPDTRNATTHKFDVAGHEGYITVGLYDDGSPGEIFIRMAKEGSTIGGLMDTIATLVSVSLQYGVPVESLVRKFEHVRFEPSGMTRNPEIPFAKSLVDYIFRWLAMEFVHGYRAANAPKREPRPAAEAAADAEPVAEAPAPQKGGNGHGPRIEPDSARPFAYSEQEMKADKTSPGRPMRRAARIFAWRSWPIRSASTVPKCRPTPPPAMFAAASPSAAAPATNASTAAIRWDAVDVTDYFNRAGPCRPGSARIRSDQIGATRPGSVYQDATPSRRRGSTGAAEC